MKICIFGAASNSIDSLYISKVVELGEELGKRGHTLIFGAGKTGVMGAAARGTRKTGGEIIGIVPTFFEEYEVIYENCTTLLKTETMRERKELLESMADAFVIAPGGIGTFDEFFETLTNKSLGVHSKPIAIYNVNHYYDALENLLKNTVDYEFMEEEVLDLCPFFDNLDDIFSYFENYKAKKMSVLDMKDLK